MTKKKIIIFVFTFLLTLSFVTTSFAKDSPPGFTDVPEKHWAREQIESFVSQGIVDGYGDGTFRPENGVTREEFCKLLAVAFNQKAEMPDTQSFADVDSQRWSYPYIEMCRPFLTGYINPFGGLPLFRPAEYATREDIAVALVKMMDYDEDSHSRYALKKFSDGEKITPSLLGYVSIAAEKGIINGYPDGTFRPGDKVSRAETVVLLSRVTKMAVDDMNFKKSAPVLEVISYPADTTEKIVEIRGTVEDENEVTVMVDGEYADVFMEEWSVSKVLSPGRNVIKIIATNKYDLSSQETIVINYTEPKTEEPEKPKAYAGIAIVTKVSKALDEDGEEVTRVSCVRSGKEGTVIFWERSINRGANHQPDVGDAFMFNTDSLGRVTDYIFIASAGRNGNFSLLGSEAALEEVLSTRSKQTDLILGYIENESREFISRGEVVTVKGQRYLVSDSTNQYTLDTQGRTRTIEVSDFMYDADFFEPEYDEEGNPTGKAHACPVLIRTVNGLVVDIYASNARIAIDY